MGDVIFTNIEPLQNLQEGLIKLRDHIRPIEQRFKKVLNEYDCEIAETIGALEKDEDDNIDQEDRRKRLEQKKADLQETKAVIVTYTHARDEFLRALDAFYSSEDNTSDGGLGMLSNSIAALENYLNAGSGETSTYQRSGSNASQVRGHETSFSATESEVDPSDGNGAGPVLRKGQNELWMEGNRAIDRVIEVMRDDLRDKDYDKIQISRIIRERLLAMREELSRDIAGDSPPLQDKAEIDIDSIHRKTR